MTHTPGPWKASPLVGGTIISSTPINTDGRDTGHNHKEYYGGYCIAESISTDEDLHLISAAPDLLEVLKDLESDAVNRINQEEFWNKFYKAIWKARGRN